MAKIKGTCHNYDGCDLAEKKIIQEVDESNFICEECGKQLFVIESDLKPKKPLLAIAAAVAGLAVLGGGGYALFGGDSADVAKLLLNKHNKTINVAQVKSDTLVASVSPKDADIIWTSSNNDVLSVNDGIVAVKGEGGQKVVIYAQIKDSEIKDSCVYQLDSQEEVVETQSTPKTEAKTQAKAQTSKVSNDNYGTVNLGYGIYTGDLKNGKPHGHGTIKYKSSHKIVSSKEFVANAGDEFEGDFRDGKISGNIGYWKHDGDVTGIKP